MGESIQLFDVVRDRPIDEKPSQRAICPTCGGHNLRHDGSRSTLIGGGDGTRDGDPNHCHDEYGCIGCGLAFVRETKSGNVWYTNRDARVLRGMPSCFEHYVYTCGKCGGSVERHYTQPDGTTPVTSLGYSYNDGNMTRSFRIFYACITCQHGGEVDTEYWRHV